VEELQHQVQLQLLVAEDWFPAIAVPDLFAQAPVFLPEVVLQAVLLAEVTQPQPLQAMEQATAETHAFMTLIV
jgi:hypothetical protein